MDLDQENNREKRKDTDPNIHRFQIARTKKLDMFALEAYLNKKSDFNSQVLECMTFIDHLIRTGPSKYLLAIKRSFYANSEERGFNLGMGVNAYKGIYQAARIAEGGRMVINADVSNGCFWSPHTPLLNLCCEFIGCGSNQLLDALRSRLIGGVAIDKGDSPGMRQAKRLCRLRFYVKYHNMPEHLKGKIFTVHKIVAETPETFMFPFKDPQTGVEKPISLAMYFHKVYNHDFEKSGAVITTAKGNAYAMECCYVVPGQRYPYKLDEAQTANMIKFAVTRPTVRSKDIREGVQRLDWAGDRYLKHYGMQIDNKMIQTRARLLQPPQLEFGRKRTVDPKTNGSWRIEGQEFLEPNAKPLKNWGIMQLNHFGRGRTLAKPAVQHFLLTMISEYQKYGGTIANKEPPIMDGSDQDLGEAVSALYTRIGKDCKADEAPQLMVFIVNGKTKDTYDRLKKSCDCRFGVVSQVLQSAHVAKCAPQYIGNVLMKVNAKLGGCTARAIPPTVRPGGSHTYFNAPTLVMGADVSHPGPGSVGASMAAVSVSMDKAGIKYVAAAETNGHRIEVIAKWNWQNLVRPLLVQWILKFNGLIPSHVIYMRDGVSEGQYQAVLQQELRDLKAVWLSIPRLDAARVAAIKYTIIICSKRHHIRMFPGDQNADQNQNVLPGTLVERDVTTARDWDFYLCAHKAIQGTARPVHYAVIKDENNTPPDYLIRMINDHSYQYVRSSTSVSIHPAVYYAHLAARRAVGHERDPHGYGRGGTNRPSEEDERALLEESKLVAEYTGKKMTETAIKRLQYLTEASYPPLIAMKNDHQILQTMWFV